MTQYLLAVHHAGLFPDLPVREWEQSFADVGAVNARMRDAGAFVFAGGLLPGSATVVRQSGDDFLITDGPFTETKELLAGFWIIDVADMDEALKWAKLAAAAELRPIEVRPFFAGDLDDAIMANAPDAP